MATETPDPFDDTAAPDKAPPATGKDANKNRRPVVYTYRGRDRVFLGTFKNAKNEDVEIAFGSRDDAAAKPTEGVDVIPPHGEIDGVAWANALACAPVKRIVDALKKSDTLTIREV